MLKDELTNQVLMEMNEVLGEEQKDTLKSVLTVLFYNFDIHKKETHLTTVRDDNYFYIEKLKQQCRFNIGHLQLYIVILIP